MYWMRMPFYRQMQTGESRRSSTDAEGPVRGIGLVDPRLKAYRTMKKPRETIRGSDRLVAISALPPEIYHSPRA